MQALPRAPFRDDGSELVAIGTRPLRRALKQVRKQLESGAKLVWVTGPAGVGKTVLSLALPGILRRQGPVVRLVAPGTDAGQRAALQKALGLDRPEAVPAALKELEESGRRVVCILDAAERASAETLERWAGLVPDASPGGPGACRVEPSAGAPNEASRSGGRGGLCAVVLSSEDELPAAVSKWLAGCSPERVDLEPLRLDEIEGYIERRLERAGYTGPALFSGGAIDALHLHSRGLPRGINRICAEALDRAVAEGVDLIDELRVEEALGSGPASRESCGGSATTEPEGRAVLGKLQLVKSARSSRPAVTPVTVAPLPAEVAPAADALRVSSSSPSSSKAQAEPSASRAPVPRAAPIDAAAARCGADGEERKAPDGRRPTRRRAGTVRRAAAPKRTVQAPIGRRVRPWWVIGAVGAALCAALLLGVLGLGLEPLAAWLSPGGTDSESWRPESSRPASSSLASSRPADSDSSFIYAESSDLALAERAALRARASEPRASELAPSLDPSDAGVAPGVPARAETGLLASPELATRVPPPAGGDRSSQSIEVAAQRRAGTDGVPSTRATSGDRGTATGLTSGTSPSRIRASQSSSPVPTPPPPAPRATGVRSVSTGSITLERVAPTSEPQANPAPSEVRIGPRPRGRELLYPERPASAYDADLR